MVGMESLAEIAARYDTDKSASGGYLGDFEEVFGGRRAGPAAILELGIFHGGSLQMWRDYFADGPVVGLDLNPVEIPDASGRIRTYVGSQDDPKLLDRIRADCAPDGFDLIIDDCAHIGRLASASFWHLYPRHLRPGGIYVVEDWGTGYWDSWSDGRHLQQGVGLSGRIGAGARGPASWLGRRPGLPGKVGRKISRSLGAGRLPSHDFGMVGFVKQLIDECGMTDVTAPGRGGLSPARSSIIEKMRISTGHVFIYKPGDAEVRGVDGR
jgi:SAM-dependent methyltransferase